MEELLKFSNITKKYSKKTALENISLTLPKGSIVGLLGPNGSGKTTLLKLAAGLLTPNEGSIEISGHKPGVESKELIAYQPDKVYLNDWMNVEQLIKMMSDFFKTFNSQSTAVFCD